MDFASTTSTSTGAGGPASIAIVGGGPSALVLAIALARRGLRTTLFERDAHPEIAPRFNPDRSYTIDISGHGLKALRHIDACSHFDQRVNRFKGIKVLDRAPEEWREPGWTGSRGDILRALMALAAERHAEAMTFEFESPVTAVDVEAGSLTCTDRSGAPVTRRFDFVVGADGAGSVVRNAMLAQIEGFSVATRSFPNHCTMLELDRVGDQLDKHYLHMLSLRPFCVAGAIRGDQGEGSSRWFCCVGTRARQAYASVEAARRLFRDRCPRILELASDERIAEFARRTCYHIGKRLTCSQLHGGKAVLLGDAAAAFPPIGQGVNAAMESAMLLDLCIGEVGHSAAALADAARLYHQRWQPEAEAVAWLSERNLFENRFHLLRMQITVMLGLNVAEEAKSATLPYSMVKRRAQRLWPLWA